VSYHPLSHSRHNAGDRSRKVGHEIKESCKVSSKSSSSSSSKTSSKSRPYAVAYSCIQAGLYIMTLFDWYSGGLNVIVIALCEVCGIAWIYGM